MAEALSAPGAFGPEQMTLSTELLQALTAGDKVRLVDMLSDDARTASHVAIEVNGAGASPGAVSPPRVGTSCRLLGVASNGNTALHLVASRGHAELAALICEKAPSLVAARNMCLDTPLHCAARAGHREVAECLLSAMRAGGAEEAAALRARNRQGATSLYEAVRHGCAGVVDAFMTASPELASVTNDDGVSVLYLAVTLESRRMVRALLRRSPDGAPSPASFTGPEGRTAMHVAAACCKEVVMDILAWKPEGPTLLTKVDSSGKSPLHFAVLHYNLDAVELLLNVEASLVRISDKDGLYPLHAAAMVGSTRIIDELITKCHDYYEMVDDKGRNFLHCAVEHARDKVVDHICRNDKFDMLLNATDDEGNTPLHLAVKHGHPRIVTLLLQTMSVKTCIINKNGLTVLDLAHEEVLSGSNYFLDPHMIVFNCLCSSEPNLYTVEGIQLLRVKDRPATETEASMKEDGMTKTGTIASVLIATVAFAAAFTVPGGFIADDHPNAGTAILARKFAFRAFVVSDTMAFVCSIVATSFHIYGGAWEIPPNHRSRYNRLASGLVPVGVQFMVAAFAFGLHLVLGAADLGLIILVYIVSSASVLFCFPSIWVPLHLGVGKAIWRRAGWRGLADMHYSPSNLRDLFDCFIYSFLFQNIRRPFFAVLICAMFIVAIVLEITLPNY